MLKPNGRLGPLAAPTNILPRRCCLNAGLRASDLYRRGVRKSTIAKLRGKRFTKP